MESRTLAVQPELREFTIDYTEFASLAASDTNQDVSLFTLKAGYKIIGAEVKPTVLWAGPSLSALTVSVGKSGAVTAFTAAYSLVAAVADTTLQETGDVESTSVADVPVLANFVATGCDLTDLTAGEVRIRLWVMKLMSPNS